MRQIENEFVADCALCALEAVDMFVPGPVREMNVELEVRDGTPPLVLSSAKATLGPGDVAERPPGLQALRDQIDQMAWPIPASFAFSRIQEELSGLGVSWDGTRATCTVEGDRARVRLGDIAEIPISPALYAERLFTDPLGRAFQESVPAAIERQNALGKELQGLKRWDWDGKRGTLDLELPGGKRQLRAVPIGSYSHEMTFLWSWANSSIDPATTQLVRSLADPKAGAGLGLFRRRGFYCSEDFARRFTLLAAARLGARAVFPPRTGGMIVFFALLH